MNDEQKKRGKLQEGITMEPQTMKDNDDDNDDGKKLEPSDNKATKIDKNRKGLYDENTIAMTRCTKDDHY